MRAEWKPTPNPDLRKPAKAEIPGRHLLAEDLFNGSNTLLVQHEGETYTLRRTRNGKLILTK